MHIRKNIVSVLAAGALLIAIPGTAGAPKIFGLPNANGACSLTGTGDGSYVGGSLTVTSFEAKGETLVARVDLTASCQIGGEQLPSTESIGTADASILDAAADHLVLGLLGTTQGRDLVFQIDSDLTIEAEKSASSVVRRVHRAPTMDAATLAAILNRYLGVR
jgi:hypothetical protein